MKISRKLYQFSRQCENGEIFYLDKKGNYCFRYNPFKGGKVIKLYQLYKGEIIDYLHDLFEYANIIDKKVILEILNEIKKL